MADHIQQHSIIQSTLCERMNHTSHSVACTHIYICGFYAELTFIQRLLFPLSLYIYKYIEPSLIAGICSQVLLYAE